MKDLEKLVLALAVLCTCIVVGGVAYAASSGTVRAKSPAAKRAPAAHVRSTRAHARVKSQSRAKAAQGRENTATDPDNVQSGDQTAPDTPGQAENQSESESSAETEQGQPGEPAQGHEDPPGQDVNHECTGNCQE